VDLLCFGYIKLEGSEVEFQDGFARRNVRNEKGKRAVRSLPEFNRSRPKGGTVCFRQVLTRNNAYNLKGFYVLFLSNDIFVEGVFVGVIFTRVHRHQAA